MSAIKESIIESVNAIPVGRISSYGRIATQVSLLIGEKVSGRVVGRILSSMPQEERTMLPWWRVVNRLGVISSMKLGEKGLLQKTLLSDEGVQVKDSTIIDREKIMRDFS